MSLIAINLHLIFTDLHNLLRLSDMFNDRSVMFRATNFLA